jgi:cobalt-zinc-cadmium resistance protein CzcA
LPVLTGNQFNAAAVTPGVPQRRLGDLVRPAEKGSPSQFLRPGASTIYREQGQRFIALKFDVRGRDLAGTVAEARARVEPLVALPYRTEWSGEFEEMEQAERRLVVVVSITFTAIVILLYLAFRSVLDVLVVLSNVLAVSLGGLWALKLTGLNFNVSAAVGFISILGVAVMNGLILVSSFNALRARGVAVSGTIREGLEHRVRPLMMTILTAVLGLLPAALSTKIGSESQKPLAIVVVGGMLMTLVLMNLIPVLYSFYGQRTPPAGAGDLAH